MANRVVGHPLSPDRHAWVQLVKGRLSINGEILQAGDGAAVSHEPNLHFEAQEASEFLLIDLN
jgi:redox-sensitive bicupin YhaK (pirin superfamily)